MSSAPRVIVWAAGDQQVLVRDALGGGKLRLIACGSETPEGSAALSKALQVDRADDLRQAIHRDDVDLLWLAGPEPIDAETRLVIAERGLPAISCQPQPGSIAEQNIEVLPSGRVEFVPLMRRSPGIRAAAEALPQFGQAQCVNVFFRSGPGQGTLFSRLYDAMDVVHSLCGQPETINAALAGPLPAVPETMSGLRGHMTINMRFKSNRCACIALSDCAGSWFRGVTILGEGGSMRISDGGFDWIGADGRILDAHPLERSLSPGALIGIQIARLMDDLTPTEPPADTLSLLALCEAARLSCLTGQDEAPAKLVELLSRP